jgi:hypothetical protein
MSVAIGLDLVKREDRSAAGSRSKYSNWVWTKVRRIEEQLDLEPRKGV